MKPKPFFLWLFLVSLTFSCSHNDPPHIEDLPFPNFFRGRLITNHSFKNIYLFKNKTWKKIKTDPSMGESQFLFSSALAPFEVGFSSPHNVDVCCFIKAYQDLGGFAPPLGKDTRLAAKLPDGTKIFVTRKDYFDVLRVTGKKFRHIPKPRRGNRFEVTPNGAIFQFYEPINDRKSSYDQGEIRYAANLDQPLRTIYRGVMSTPQFIDEGSHILFRHFPEDDPQDGSPFTSIRTIDIHGKVKSTLLHKTYFGVWASYDSKNLAVITDGDLQLYNATTGEMIAEVEMDENHWIVRRAGNTDSNYGHYIPVVYRNEHGPGFRFYLFGSRNLSPALSVSPPEMSIPETMLTTH